MAAKAGDKSYQNFEITIRQAAGGGYEVEARIPPDGSCTPFASPFDESYRKRLDEDVERLWGMTPDFAVPDQEHLTVDLGRTLFDAAIGGEVRDLFLSARRDAERGGYGLRLQLRLSHVPELANLPWELLYDGRGFLALSGATPLVRYLDLRNPPQPMKVAPPLRILVTVSVPLDQPDLDVTTEEARVREALRPLAERGMLEFEVAPDVTLSGLRLAMRRAKRKGRPYHVWHYVGHGAFDPARGGSVLVFCDPKRGESCIVDGFELSTLLNDYPEMRLVLLNACESACLDPKNPFAGVAAALVERGVPAVIGMQRKIGDDTAATLADEFYEALVDGLPVDAALTEARLAVFSLPNLVEWATPVLFMRASDGKIFEVSAPAPADEPVAPPSTMPVAGEIGEPVAPGPRAEPVGAEPFVEPTMVTVPAGKFLMGTPESEMAELEKLGLRREEIEREIPQHEIHLEEYAIGRYPVTNAEFKRFIDDGGYEERGYWTDVGWREKEKDGWKQPRCWDDEGWNDPAHPVVGVSWYEAMAYCNWLAVRTGKPYRLPSEAEWEKAARGADGRRYPWGDEWDPKLCNNRELGWGRTAPVGDYSPVGDSPYGVGDIAGQVREWCGSKYGGIGDRPRFGYPYDAGYGREDPEGDDTRIARGGSWYDNNPAAACRCAFRGYGFPNVGIQWYGFRCARASSSIS